MEKRLADSTIQVRWMLRRDLAEVLAIENASFEFAWDEADFVTPRQLGRVVELDGQVIGYIVYERNPDSVSILNFAVAGGFRRRGFGGALFAPLKARVFGPRRDNGPWRRLEYLECTVRETNLAAQLFLRAQGFRAVRVLRGLYAASEDAYRFRFTNEEG